MVVPLTNLTMLWYNCDPSHKQAKGATTIIV
jgi:hypothetical protein